MDRDPEDIPANAQLAEEVSLPVDPAERKRVLNILAQRRYRRRRRERQAALEKLVSLSRSFDPVNAVTDHPKNESLRNSNSPSTSSTDSNTYSNPDTSNPNTSSDSDSTTSIPVDTSLTSTLINWPGLEGSSWLERPFGDPTDFSNLLRETQWDGSKDFAQLNDFLQADDVQNASFADDFHIAVTELDLLRAAYENASRVNSTHLLFAGLSAQSVFQTSDCSSWILDLPENLMPTEAQLVLPHHPAIDVLPWPAVRNRLIKMYNMPSDLWPRHPEDGTESSFVRFIYDMEDGGVKVTGPDPAKESAWEVEERFFECWWWALDQAIVANSNLKRLARGQPMLGAPSPGN